MSQKMYLVPEGVLCCLSDELHSVELRGESLSANGDWAWEKLTAILLDPSHVCSEADRSQRVNLMGEQMRIFAPMLHMAGITIHVDHTLPPCTAEFRDFLGRPLVRVVNLEGSTPDCSTSTRS